MSTLSHNRAKLLRTAMSVAAACLLSMQANAVTITQLASESELLSTSVFSTDFESGVINGDVWFFDSSATLTAASSAVRGMTPSGMKGLTESRGREPLSAFLMVEAYEVGMYFGNDDFGLIFDAELAVFDLMGTLLGSVVVTSNGNDYADQFIGLRSDTPFQLVSLSYARPEAQGLSLYVDDFIVGITPPAAPQDDIPSSGSGAGGGASVELPEPASVLLLGLALLMTTGVAGMRGAPRLAAHA